MKHYKLRYVMHDPSEDTEHRYMAEIPALPGCRAWGDTPEDTLDILESLAAAFIDIHGTRLWASTYGHNYVCRLSSSQRTIGSSVIARALLL